MKYECGALVGVRERKPAELGGKNLFVPRWSPYISHARLRD